MLRQRTWRSLFWCLTAIIIVSFQIHLHWTIILDFERVSFCWDSLENSSQHRLKRRQKWCCFNQGKSPEHNSVFAMSAVHDCGRHWTGWSSFFFSWFCSHSNNRLFLMKQHPFCQLSMSVWLFLDLSSKVASFKVLIYFQFKYIWKETMQGVSEKA